MLFAWGFIDFLTAHCKERTNLASLRVPDLLMEGLSQVAGSSLV